MIHGRFCAIIALNFYVHENFEEEKYVIRRAGFGIHCFHCTYTFG